MVWNRPKTEAILSCRAPRYHSEDACCPRNRPESTKPSRTASYGAWPSSVLEPGSAFTPGPPRPRSGPEEYRARILNCKTIHIHYGPTYSARALAPSHYSSSSSASPSSSPSSLIHSRRRRARAGRADRSASHFSRPELPASALPSASVLGSTLALARGCAPQRRARPLRAPAAAQPVGWPPPPQAAAPPW